MILPNPNEQTVSLPCTKNLEHHVARSTDPKSGRAVCIFFVTHKMKWKLESNARQSSLHHTCCPLGLNSNTEPHRPRLRVGNQHEGFVRPPPTHLRLKDDESGTSCTSMEFWGRVFFTSACVDQSNSVSGCCATSCTPISTQI